jgi:polar amino acid transport system substrate-binding protein
MPKCPASRSTLFLLFSFVFFLQVVFLLLTHIDSFAAQPEQPIRVGIRDIQPFVFLEEHQEPRGYSIDLWQAIAEDLHLQFTYRPSSGIASTLEEMKSGKLDIAIGAITITENREKVYDFSYSHFHTGLGILTKAKDDYSVSAFVSSFCTHDRLLKLGSFALFLILSAHIIWLVERRYAHSFHRNYFPGIFEGIYWTVVTASTVGYGDYIPKSKAGRILAVLIIIISLPLFGIFIASLSSDITLHELKSVINSPQDLVGKRVGVVKSSTSEEYLQKDHLACTLIYGPLKDLFGKLEQGQLDAIVHDQPTLQYYANNNGRGKVILVGKMFNRQDYGFLFPERSDLKENIDRTLLKLIENGTITTLHQKWFGTSEEN